MHCRPGISRMQIGGYDKQVTRKQKKGGSSLQDQLRKVGLVSEKQLRRAQKGKHKKDMQLKHGQVVDEDKIAAQRTRAEKVASDLQQNQERDQQARIRSVMAQVRQLIELNSKLEAGDLPYNFIEQKKVKKIYVSRANQIQLNKGCLAIVKTSDSYDLVPEKVARKIMARRDDVVLYLYNPDQDLVDEDDPYKDFKIPDDLEW